MRAVESWVDLRTRLFTCFCHVKTTKASSGEHSGAGGPGNEAMKSPVDLALFPDSPLTLMKNKKGKREPGKTAILF